jgi:hypothetical protein
MGVNEIHDVDIIADGSAIVSGVIGAEDRERLSLARHGFKGNRDDMRFRAVIFAE